MLGHGNVWRRGIGQANWKNEAWAAGPQNMFWTGGMNEPRNKEKIVGIKDGRKQGKEVYIRKEWQEEVNKGTDSGNVLAKFQQTKMVSYNPFQAL